MTEQNSNNLETVKYQIYIEERRSLVEASLSSAEQFDKYILTLASGALALSLTFIKNIAPTPVQYSIIILSISWLCLIASMLSTLISFLTSQKACSSQIQILENSYLNQCSDEQNCMSQVTKWLNRISISCFILGVIFLSIFSIINLNTSAKGDQMTKKSEQQPLKEGYVPPAQPAQPQMGKKGYVPPPSPQKPKTDGKSGD